jgi:polysaccharide pyruvyl transferase WcaK-like protein
MGVGDAQIVGDLACEMACDEPWPIDDRPAVMVNIAIDGMADIDSLETLAEVATHLASLHRDGVRLVPVAMHASDVSPTSSVLARADVPHGEISVPSSFEDFATLVGPCQYGIAVRLHAAVLAGCVGVPTLMLGYREKCLDFMESVGLERLHVQLERGRRAEVLAAIETLEAHSGSLRAELLSNIRRYQSSLRSYVDTLIHSEPGFTGG